MTSSSSSIPPEITFVSLPQALAQFHHLPIHVPIWIHRQPEFEKKGYDFNEGVGAMEELLQHAPNAPGAYLYRLFTRKWPRLSSLQPYFDSGRIAEVIPKLIEVLDIDPECPLTCFQLGFCFRATGELEKSEAFYQKALRMAPDAGWVHSNLARTYLALGQKAKAVEALWAAWELMPGDTFILEQLVSLGEVFPETAQAEGEIRFLRKKDHEKKMMEILSRETQAESLVQHGWKATRDGLWDTACRFFEKALTLPDRGPGPLLGLGVAHLQAQRFEQAERFLLEYLDEDPGSAVGHLNLFKAYLAQKEMDLAWEELKTSVQLDPNRLEVLTQFFHFFKESQREEEGLELLQRIAEERPENFAPRLVLAQALAQEDRWDEAEQKLKETLQQHPQKEEVLLFYTAELGKRGRPQNVVDLLDGRTDLSLALIINLALAYGQQKKFEKSRQVLRSFIEREGIRPEDKKKAADLLKEFEKS